LDGTKFAECLETRRYQDEVEADYTYAAELGIRSTPTFFINGLAVVGAQPFEVFQTLIDQELASKAP
jgi:predicted DsbA family dithiol-disulfide isomerase